jgi:hypothetical protein
VTDVTEGAAIDKTTPNWGAPPPLLGVPCQVVVVLCFTTVHNVLIADI